MRTIVSSIVLSLSIVQIKTSVGLFTGWVNTIITAIQDESIVLGLVSIFAAPFAALYGLYLFF